MGRRYWGHRHQKPLKPHKSPFGLLRESDPETGETVWRTALWADEYLNYSYDDYLPGSPDTESAVFYDRINSLYPLSTSADEAYRRCRDSSQLAPQFCRLLQQTNVHVGNLRPEVASRANKKLQQLVFYTVTDRQPIWYNFQAYAWKDWLTLDPEADDVFELSEGQQLQRDCLQQLFRAEPFRVPGCDYSDKEFGSEVTSGWLAYKPGHQKCGIASDLLKRYAVKREYDDDYPGWRQFIVNGVRRRYQTTGGGSAWKHVSFYKNDLHRFASGLYSDCRNAVGDIKYWQSWWDRTIDSLWRQTVDVLRAHEQLYGRQAYRYTNEYQTLMSAFCKQLEPNLRVWARQEPGFVQWFETEYASRAAKLLRAGRWQPKQLQPGRVTVSQGSSHYVSKLLPKLTEARKQAAAKQRRLEAAAKRKLRTSFQNLSEQCDAHPPGAVSDIPQTAGLSAATHAGGVDAAPGSGPPGLHQEDASADTQLAAVV